MADEDRDPQAPLDAAPPERKRRGRLFLVGVLVAVGVAFALDNSHEVKIGWVFGDGRAPLVVALAIAFVLGLAIGWLVSWLRGRR
jgi:uncharacterized integral membrane protein